MTSQQKPIGSAFGAASTTRDVIHGIDLSGICIFCNSSCAKLLGYNSPAALIGKQLHPLIHHTRPDGTPYAPEQSPIYGLLGKGRGSALASAQRLVRRRIRTRINSEG